MKIKNYIFNIILFIIIPLLLACYFCLDWKKDLIFCLIAIICLSIFYLVFIKINKFKVDEKILKKIKNISLNKIFLIYSIIIGLILSFVIPLYMIPDEVIHINLMYQERNLDYEFYDINQGYHGSEEIMMDDKARVEKKDYFDFSKRINVDKIFSIPKITIIKHLPQVVGMIIGEILHLPVFFYLMLMEICALLCYVFICNKALKKMPFKKGLFMVIMLLPVCLQQMASVSYDVMLLCTSFLYIASIFDLKFKSEKITLKDILLLILYLGIITICKIPYGILGLLIFILPISKIDIKIFKINIKGDKIKNYILHHKIISLLSFIIILFILGIIGYKFLLSFNSGRVLLASILNPIDTAKLLFNTIKGYLFFYVDTVVGNFGIFNVKTNRIVDFIILISILLISLFNFKIIDGKLKAEDNKFSKWDLFIIYLTFIIISYFIILAMLEWTLYITGIENYNNLTLEQIAYYIKIINIIGGVQGRYFVPILPLLLIPLGNKKISEKTLKFNPILFEITYFISLGLYMILFLTFRYWI